MATTTGLRLPAVASIAQKTAATAAKKKFGRPFLPISSFSSESGGKSKKLVLYTKQGCCLCEGLKEKLDAAFLLGGNRSLHEIDLQVRDISQNSEWEQRYQYEIPVLARLLSDGSEVESSFRFDSFSLLPIPGNPHNFLGFPCSSFWFNSLLVFLTLCELFHAF